MSLKALMCLRASLVAQLVKNPPTMQENTCSASSTDSELRLPEGAQQTCVSGTNEAIQGPRRSGHRAGIESPGWNASG